jgi:hypothetical protein
MEEAAGEYPEAVLVERLKAIYGLEPAMAARLVEEFVLASADTVEEWVRSRHIRLQRTGLKNEAIYRRIAEELPFRRFAAPPLSVRQIRRLIYG